MGVVVGVVIPSLFQPVIELEMKFPKDYPMNPPFVRVIRPRFQFLTGLTSIDHTHI